MPGPITKMMFANTPFDIIETPVYAQRKATGKKPNDQYAEAASIMVLVHNVIIRGLNSIYKQALHVKSEDYADFIAYATCWCEFTDNHHNNEDESIFPTIEAQTGEKGIMDEDLEQHRAFIVGFRALKSYLDSVAETPARFSGAQLVSLLDEFAPQLHHHLTDEIPRMVALSRFGDRISMLKIIETEGNRSAQALSKTGAMIFFLRNSDLEFEDGLWKNWPPIPGPVRWSILKTLGRWHVGWWRFASCDESGRMQQLYAGN
ncbi:hypothetical protein TCE0_039f12998 [Talaromyces pinophilus]|uniref:Hemerythrin-like domain-containing protein n=1 Tax=Talaromyces pinophilus TaxID=128442 RepID=A0A6N4SLF9_TALPI|nr:hypothetical protein TCE0_039f12998 [Talaromyces pinophilus]